MRRTTITLEERQYKYLKELAMQEGTSMSALIRRYIESAMKVSRLKGGKDKLSIYIPPDADTKRKRSGKRTRREQAKRSFKEDPIFSIVGMFRGERENVAEKHDEYLYTRKEHQGRG